jgi:putative heme-binding domain-containing protein
VEWERTASIAETLDLALSDPDFSVRAAIVRRMLREGIPVRWEQLTRWLKEDHSAEGVAAILFALEARPAAEIRPAVEEIVASSSFQNENRLAAFAMLVRELDADGVVRLRQMADKLDEGPVLAAAIRELARRPDETLSVLLTTRLSSQDDDVRAACAAALAQQPAPEIAQQVVELLADRDVRVRRAAAVLAGKLQVRGTVPPLLAAAEALDRPLRGACLEALLQLDDPQAVSAAVRSLDDAETQVAGMNYLGKFGSPEHVAATLKAVNQSRSVDLLLAAVRALLNWRDRSQSPEERTALEQAIAQIQGVAGLPILWHTQGPLGPNSAEGALAEALTGGIPLESSRWQRIFVNLPDAIVHLQGKAESAQAVWLAAADLILDRSIDVEMLVTVKGPLKLRLNGKVLVESKSEASDVQKTHKIDAALPEGPSRLMVELTGQVGPEFQLRFRGKSSKADHERLMKLVLEGAGNAQRGRELFLNAEKTQCVKCHRIGEEGGRVGRFSRIHLVESLLEPSRTIAPSYETLAVALQSGQVLNGVKSSETALELVLGDNQGKLHKLLKSEIEEWQPQSKSTMPEGLEQRLSDREFLDLIEFLTTQKKTPLN